MRHLTTLALLVSAAAAASAQDQQLGARTKAMGGSYTAFEDDPVSVWLNPAGIATQTDQMAIAYQTYTTYPVRETRGVGDETEFSVEAETVLVDPALLPSYVGLVFQLGTPESPMAIGVCFARPYHLNYALDQITDPAQTIFEPSNNVEESLSRFRVAFAKDFRFKPPGEAGVFTHLAAGIGLDLGYERWEFTSAGATERDTSIGVGFGLGVLVCVYDNIESFKVNVGLAYSSKVEYDFDIDPDILPAFDMPEQFNFGVTFYLLQGTPLRITLDLQFISWEETAEDPLFGGFEKFEDVLNYSIGFEYKIEVKQGKIWLYPRLGYRRFDAPWGDEDDLPATGAFKLVLDTDGESFNIFTIGVGVQWSTESSKLRAIDIGADFGGDSFNVAAGYTHEF